jgi:hypothetical protein
MRVLLCGVKGGEFAVREGSFVRPRLAVSSAAIAGVFALLVFAGSGGAAGARSASGAATAKAQKVTRIDVSTRADVIHYLRSIQVNPKGAVIQRGLRNYAGAHCPGKHWTCAGTRHTVVQIAKRGGQNRFMCRSSKCVVVQFTGTAHGVYVAGRQAAAAPTKPPGDNNATCVKTGSGATTGGGQTCSITQSGSGKNTAGVYQNTMKVSGLVQTAQYTATITQTSSGSGNTACVTQNISLDGSTSNTNGKPTTVNLQAFQTITIQQDSLAGNNSARQAATSTGACDTNSTSLAQSQTLTSTVSATGNITQNMDTMTTNPQGTAAANVVTDIEQNQGTNFKGFASGLNNAAFTQTSNQVAIANAVTGATVTQQQDANVPNPPYSGIVGTINQDSSNISTASATQNETQCEDAANTKNSAPLTGCSNTADSPTGLGALIQTQYGPMGIFAPPAKSTGRVLLNHKGYGASQQTGRPQGGDSFTLNQTSTQNTDGAGPHTTITQSNIIQGDCLSVGGSCQAGQQATLNGQDTNDGYTAPSITGSNTLIINCTNGHGSCTATPPPAPAITSHPTNPSESTSATFTWTEAATAGVTLKCSIDGGTTFTTCDSPTSASYSNLALGSHTFKVKAVDNTPSHNESATDSFTWTIVPYLTFEATADGASAGWTGDVPGSSITLKVGSVSATTFGQFTLHNFEGIAIGDLDEPTFTTDAYSGGAPREEIDFSNGDYVFGYPSQAGFGTDSWQLVCDGGCVTGGFMSWADVQAAEPADTTVAAALVEADGGVPDGTTFVISAFAFDGYSLSDFTNHWHNG